MSKRKLAVRTAGVLALIGRGRGEQRYFRDQAFHFQTLRALNNIRTDGADTAEVLETIGHIREGDVHSWYGAWEATANRVLERAGRIGDARSRGQALLRAHNYLRTAEFFLPPTDPKRPVMFRRNVEAFESGLNALGVARERMRIPYGSNHLNAIVYPGPPGAERRPLLVLCGGFDSTLEELYFVLVPAAHERGFAVLTFEGPGQGAVLREQKLVFTPEWERPTAAVLDAYFALHPRRTKTVLIGMSMGGYLAPRAAAFDRRIDGVVAFDVLFDFGVIARQSVPPFALWLHAHHADAVLDALIAAKARLSPGFAWSIENGQWVLGTTSAIETVKVLGSYTLAPVAGRIEADVLILAGAEDHFIPSSQAADFARALTAARSVRSIVYDRASGGAEHCQMGAQSLWHADLFDWVERIDSSIGGGAARQARQDGACSASGFTAAQAAHVPITSVPDRATSTGAELGEVSATLNSRTLLPVGTGESDARRLVTAALRGQEEQARPARPGHRVRFTPDCLGAKRLTR